MGVGVRLPTWRLGILLLLWYSSSAVTSITTKTILRAFPFPITLAVVQQLVAAAGGGLTAGSSLADACLRGKICEERGAGGSSPYARAVAVLPVAAVMVAAGQLHVRETGREGALKP